jgi:hypothetical protein
MRSELPMAASLSLRIRIQTDAVPGVDEDLIHELTLGLEPEDGVIWVYGVDDGDGTLALTDEGVEEVELLLAEYNRIRSSKP